MVMRLRFALHGHRNYKVYHLVAVNQKARRDARPAELLGKFDPHLKPDATAKVVEWSVERIRYWLSVGAQPTKSVAKLLRLGGILPPEHNPHKYPVPTPAIQDTSKSSQ